MALRSLQLLGPLLKVSVNRTTYEFGDRSAGLFGQRLKLLELLFFKEERRPFHAHTVAYRHIYGNRAFGLERFGGTYTESMGQTRLNGDSLGASLVRGN
jgi:hypothetical protein